MRIIVTSVVLALVFGSLGIASEAPFSLPKLPYEANALEPVIDTQTMMTHHDQLHQGYVDGLNRMIANDPKMVDVTLSSLLAHASTLDPALRTSAGGFYNHSFFWTIMAPVGAGGELSDALGAQIIADFGSVAKMQKAFDEIGAKQPGSGWVWLVWTKTNLAVVSTPNQDNPLMDDAEIQGSPIIANEISEHAYPLKYQSSRADYLNNWWTIVNWKEASSRFAQATAAHP